MNADYFRLLFDYSCWARNRLFEQVGKLSNEAFLAPRLLDHSSIAETLFHILAVEEFWMARWSGNVWRGSLDEPAPTSLASLEERWIKAEREVRGYLSSLTDDDLAESVRYRGSRSPMEYVNPRWALIAQNSNHGTHHRSEVAMALTQVGLSPGDLDLIIYLTRRLGSLES